MDITEKQFESQVKDLAKMFGWLYYHTWRSIHSPAGFPDCVMVRGDAIIFAELKSEKGIVSPPQQEWLDALDEVSNASRDYVYDEYRFVHVYLWRPSQIDAIVEVLR